MITTVVIWGEGRDEDKKLLVHLAVRTEYHRILLMVLEASKFKTNMLGYSVSGKSPLFGLQTPVFSLSPHVVKV